MIVAAATGARRSELVALRWSDIDVGRACVTIRHGVVLGPDGLVEKGTKTHAVRNVSLDPTTLAALVAHQARADELALAFGTTRSPGSHVFSIESDGSSPVRPDSMSRAFRQLCARAGVAASGSMTSATTWPPSSTSFAGGVDVRTVAGRLGHRNPSTTLNVYCPLPAQGRPQRSDSARPALRRQQPSGRRPGRGCRSRAVRVRSGQRPRCGCWVIGRQRLQVAQARC